MRLSMRLVPVAVAVVLVVVSVPASSVSARVRSVGWIEAAKLIASNGETDSFGESVALDGDTLVAATTGFEFNTADSGSVFVFRRTTSGWNEITELRASDGVYAEWFGYSVDVEDDTILVGAPHTNGEGTIVNSGAAYLFSRTQSGWVESAKLTASDPDSHDSFGVSDLDGDMIIVGASGDNEAGESAGAVYVFEQSGGVWVEAQKLMTAGGDYGGFGSSVAIDGDTIAAVGSGQVYVFSRTRSGWVETAQLSASDGADLGYVALEDNTIAATGGGSLYVFNRWRSSWVETTKLEPSDGEDADRFGRRLALDGDTIVAGADGDDDLGSSSGSAYVFTRSRSGWQETQKLIASDGDVGDRFGFSVAVDDDTIAVGAWYDDVPKEFAGSVYIFTKTRR